MSDAKKSKEILFDTDYMAYPFGSANNDYKKAIKEAGYSYAFSFQNNKKLTINSDRYFLPRIEIRGDETMSDFKDKLNGKVSIMKYTKGFMKKLLHI